MAGVEQEQTDRPLRHGWSSSYYRATSRLQSPDQYPSPSRSFGAISHNDQTLNEITGAPATYSHPLHLDKPNVAAAVSYVTGSHAFKGGVQYGYGVHRTYTSSNGDMQQLYRNGVPFAVNVYDTPTFAETKLKHELGLFVQDSWTLHRLTLTPGLRYENLEEGFPAQDAPAGRFVAARHFDVAGPSDSQIEHGPIRSVAHPHRGREGYERCHK